ncbi:MAG: hypothetical protein GC138_00550 [Gammaproteobacteria bacterium]|nr:hypothetical protein [Gammaproteobacteria bacterium]
MLRSFGDFNRDMTEHLNGINGYTEDIKENVVISIRSLQFEDIVRQALEQTQREWESLQRFLGETCADIGALGQTPDNQDDALPGRLFAIRERLHEMRASLAAQKHTPVSQSSMTAGDVELF